MSDSNDSFAGGGTHVEPAETHRGRKAAPLGSTVPYGYLPICDVNAGGPGPFQSAGVVIRVRIRRFRTVRVFGPPHIGTG
jgi:hypothetical protein